MKRRELLCMATIGCAAAITGARAELQATLTSVDTLTALAARGEFFSMEMQLPHDVSIISAEFSVDGEYLDQAYEVYAPPSGEGYVVYYRENNDGERELALKRGRVEVHNLKRDYNRLV